MSLPSGYKKLEYIESSGEQYIDTGISVGPDNASALKSVIDKMILTTNAYSLDGTGYGATPYNNSFYLGTDANSNIAYGDGRADKTTSTAYDGSRRTFVYDAKNGKVSVSNLTEISFTFSVPDTALNFLLFAYNQGTQGGVKYYSGRIYGAKLYINGILVRDFVPCVNASGEVGLWDDVNSVFYVNAGTGTFTAGPVIAISVALSDIRKLEYIESSGTQFIDTGFKPNQNTTIAAEFEVLDASNDGAYLYGGGTGTARLEAYPWDGKLEFNYGSAVPFVGTVYANKRFYICQDKTKYTLSYFDGSGEWTGNHAEQSFTSAYTLAIFALNRGTVAYPTAGMKLYSCQIYDNGTLIRDYIPAKLSDGTVGLYDKLNGLLYINAGTGTFISGGYALNLPVNIGGTWKEANEAFVNIGGTWKTVKDAFVNIGGTWKELG